MRRAPGSSDYVMPFMIIICIGIILILLFNLWRLIFSKEPARAAYLHVVSGSVQMQTWGTDVFFDITSDVVVMQGDGIRTSSDAKIIVEFFDGTLMRIDGDSDIVFEAINDSSKNPEIDLNLVSGNVWFNQVYKDTGDTDIEVAAGAILVHSSEAGIFEVESGDNEVIRVFEVFENEGLLVDIMSEAQDKVIESENVGVGQEVTFSKAVLDRYWKYQSPNVLSAVSDDFKLGDWYLWNKEEDTAPTVFEKYASEEGMGFKVVEPESVVDETSVEAGTEVDEGDEVTPANEAAPADDDEISAEADAAPEIALGPLTKPVITSVAGGTQVDTNGFYRVTGKLATITGSISGAAKVVVNGYTLQKFKPGDANWTYYANADYGLMQEGENSYEVYALDASEKKSESLTVKVFYAPPAPVVEVVETEEAANEEEATADSSAVVD